MNKLKPTHRELLIAAHRGTGKYEIRAERLLTGQLLAVVIVVD
jgi:hypothetical protein